MKIRIKGIGQYRNNVDLDVRITQTTVCPAGTAYYKIDYCVDGVCIHSANTGAIYGQPNPIAMLDQEHAWNEYHDVDDQHPERGTCNGKPVWWEERKKTHRQAIIDALEQIVVEECKVGM